MARALRDAPLGSAATRGTRQVARCERREVRSLLS